MAYRLEITCKGSALQSAFDWIQTKRQCQDRIYSLECCLQSAAPRNKWPAPYHLDLCGLIQIIDKEMDINLFLSSHFLSRQVGAEAHCRECFPFPFTTPGQNTGLAQIRSKGDLWQMDPHLPDFFQSPGRGPCHVLTSHTSLSASQK